MWLQFDLWLLPSPPALSRREEFLAIERLVVFQHVKDCPCQFVREDGERFTLAVNLGQILHQLFGQGIKAHEQNCRLGERPLKMRITDLGATCTFILPGGFVVVK